MKCGPGKARTRATRFRRPVLYLLSYEPITLSSFRHWQLEGTIVQFHGMSRLILDKASRTNQSQTIENSVISSWSCWEKGRPAEST